MKKKIVILVCGLSIIVCGCGSASNSSDSTTSVSTENTGQASSEADPKATEEKTEYPSENDTTLNEPDSEVEEDTKSASTETTETASSEETAEKTGADISKFYGYAFGMGFDVYTLNSDTNENSEFGFTEGTTRFDIADTGKGYRMRGTLTVPIWLTPEQYESFLADKTITFLGETYTILDQIPEHDEAGQNGNAALNREDYTIVDTNGVETHIGSQYAPEFSKYDELYYAFGSPITLEDVEIFVPYELAPENMSMLAGENGINLAESVGENWFTIWLANDGNVNRIEHNYDGYFQFYG